MVFDDDIAEYIRKIEYEEIFREAKQAGFEEGRQEGREEVALNLLSDTDLDLDTISRFSKIELSRIIHLKRIHNIK